jgi:hypothetical protein
VNDSGILVRRAPPYRAEQIVVPLTLRRRLLHLEHYTKTAGHPEVARMFRSLRRRYFWRTMAAEVAETVKQCAVCPNNRIRERKRTSFLKLFPAAEPLAYVSIDILGPLPKTEHGNVFLLFITDLFSKLTRIVPLRVISAPAFREGVLRTLGLRLWTPAIRADRQWGTIRCEVLPFSVPRTRNSEGLHNGLSSPDE